ncbi:MAG: hypothetical protein ACYC5U_07705, partial [Rhodocyclaceae bacterium]
RQARRRGRKPAAGYALRRFPPPAKKRTIQKLQNRTGLKTRDSIFCALQQIMLEKTYLFNVIM